MGAPEVSKRQIEDDIAEEYTTTALCEKVLAKLQNSEEGFNNRRIPESLNTIYYDIIVEETWDMLKKFNNPTINYKILKHKIFGQIREKLPNIF